MKQRFITVSNYQKLATTPTTKYVTIVIFVMSENPYLISYYAGITKYLCDYTVKV